MEFTDEQLRQLAGLEPVTGSSPWFTIDALASCVLAERKRAEEAERKLGLLRIVANEAHKLTRKWSEQAKVAEGWREHWEAETERWQMRAEEAEHQLAALLDQKADREDPVEWVERGKTETVSRYDTDGRLIYHGPLDSAPAFGEFETGTRDNADHFEYVTENGVRTPIERPRKVKWYEQDEPRPLPPYMGPEPCDCEHLAEVREAGPQRPHESLVWAILFAQQVPGASSVKREILMENAINNADKLLDTWRARWPESE